MTSASAKSSHNLPAPLWWFCVACIAVTLFSWIFSSAYYHQTLTENASLWSHDPSDAFTDFTQYRSLYDSAFHTRAFYFSDGDSFAYPAPAAVLYDGLYHMGPHQLSIYLGSILAAALAAAALFFRALRRTGIATAQAALFVTCVTLTSWPLLFLFERANIEFILWLITALGVAALLHNRPMLAAALFGVAASLKLYPIVLLALLFSPRYWRAFLIGVASFGASLLLSFWFVGPTIGMAFRGTINGILGFVGNYATTAHSELGYDHSFFACFKVFASNPPWNHIDFTASTHLYVPLALLGAALLFFLRVRKLPLINQILFVMICMVALPPVSYDYTLVHLSIPFALFVLAWVRAELPDAKIPGLRRTLLCFCVLFTPQLFLIHATRSANGFIDLNGALKSGALAMLLVLLSRHPMHDSDLLAEPAGGAHLRSLPKSKAWAAHFSTLRSGIL